MECADLAEFCYCAGCGFFGFAAESMFVLAIMWIGKGGTRDWTLPTAWLGDRIPDDLALGFCFDPEVMILGVFNIASLLP